MTRPDDAPHEVLLRALILGERHASEPAIAARLASDAELAGAWREYVGLSGALGMAGELRRATLAEAGASADDEDPELRAAFRALAAEQGSGARAPARRAAHRGRALAIAAALLVGATLLLGGLLGWYASRAADPDAPRPRYLAAGELQIVPGTPFGELRLRLVDGDPRAIVIDVRAFALDARGARGALLAEREDLGTDVLALDASLLTGLRALEFEVELRRAEGGAPILDVVRQER